MIGRLVRATGAPSPPTGPGDDAAVLPDGSVVTVDTLVEGVHFDRRLSAADVGWKSIAASVSDACAMGAEPRWVLLALSLPQGFSEEWLTGFASGLTHALRAYGVALVGGDTTCSPGPIVISITLGAMPVAAPVLRSGAQAGDELWMTGWPGLAGLGWFADDPPPAALVALRHPTPSVAFATGLARGGHVHAMLDLSDGLAADLPRLCHASGLGAVVDVSALPVHLELAARADRLALQVGGGEDYGLLFAAPPEAAGAISSVAAACDVRATRIGRCTSGEGIVLAGAAWPEPLFRHFTDGS